MDRYLGGEDIDVKVLIDDLETAVARGSFYPVLAACAGTGSGMTELLEVLTSGVPVAARAPAARRHPTGRLAGRAADLRPGGPAVRRGGQDHHRPVRRADLAGTGVLRHAAPRRRPPRVRARAGRPRPRGPRRRREGRRAVEPARQDAAPGRLTRSPATSSRSPSCPGPRPATPCRPRTTRCWSRAWEMPEPLLPVAIAAKSKADEDKLSTGLQRIVAEEPTVRLERNVETAQLILWCMGEAHADVLVDRLATKYGVEVEQVPAAGAVARDLRGRRLRPWSARQAVRRARPVRGLRRRLRAAARRERLRVRRQDLRRVGAQPVHPVGGEGHPRRRWSAVSPQGYPVVDLRATLRDGKAHSVDSSDMAFQLAGGLALRDAAARGAGATCSSRCSRCRSWSPTTTSGAVMSDLSTRRGRVTGTEPVGTGGRWCAPRCPRSRSPATPSTCGRSRTAPATFSRRHLRYEPMPAHVAATAAAFRSAHSH